MSLFSNTVVANAGVTLKDVSDEVFYLHPSKQAFPAISFEHRLDAQRLVDRLILPPNLANTLVNPLHTTMKVSAEGVNTGQFRCVSSSSAQTQEYNSAALGAAQQAQYALADQLFSGKLYISSDKAVRLYEKTRNLQGRQAPAFRLGFSTDRQKPANAERFQSIGDAQNYLTKLSMPPAYWDAVLESANAEHNRRQDAMPQVAELLVQQKIWVLEKPKVEVKSHYAPAAATPPAAKNKPAQAPVSSAPAAPANANVADVSNQVETLKQAAASGAPFCEECAAQ